MDFSAINENSIWPAPAGKGCARLYLPTDRVALSSLVGTVALLQEDLLLTFLVLVLGELSESCSHCAVLIWTTE